MTEKQKAVAEKMEAFRRAATFLAWEIERCPGADDDVAAGYPFDRDFNEIPLAIQTWIEAFKAKVG